MKIIRFDWRRRWRCWENLLSNSIRCDKIMRPSILPDRSSWLNRRARERSRSLIGTLINQWNFLCLSRLSILFDGSVDPFRWKWFQFDIFLHDRRRYFRYFSHFQMTSKKSSEIHVDLDYISAACNCCPQSLDWQNGPRLIFGVTNSVALCSDVK